MPKYVGRSDSAIQLSDLILIVVLTFLFSSTIRNLIKKKTDHSELSI